MEQLQLFVASEESVKEFHGLTSSQRKLIHEAAETIGLHTRSVGSGADRYLIVSKNAIASTLDTEAIKKFVQHFKLPISVYDPTYINYYINAFDKFYRTKYFYDIFLEFIKRNPNHMAMSANLAGGIEVDITTNAEYASMQSVSYGQIPPNVNIFVNNKTFPKYYISLDIIEANFTAIRMLMPEFFSKISCWREFLSTYTTEPFYLESKHYRQVVLGQLAHKKLMAMQYRMMSELFTKLLDYPEIKIIGRVNTDEIIIEVDPATIFETTELLNTIIDKKIWRKTLFKIEPIGSSAFFLKTDYINKTPSKFSIKNVPKMFHIQAMKFSQGLPITDIDRKITITEGKYTFTATLDTEFKF